MGHVVQNHLSCQDLEPINFLQTRLDSTVTLVVMCDNFQPRDVRMMPVAPFTNMV